MLPPPSPASAGQAGSTRQGRGLGTDTGKCVKEGPSQGLSGNPASFVILDVTEDP